MNHQRNYTNRSKNRVRTQAPRRDKNEFVFQLYSYILIAPLFIPIHFSIHRIYAFLSHIAFRHRM